MKNSIYAKQTMLTLRLFELIAFTELGFNEMVTNRLNANIKVKWMKLKAVPFIIAPHSYN